MRLHGHKRYRCKSVRLRQRLMRLLKKLSVGPKSAPKGNHLEKIDHLVQQARDNSLNSDEFFLAEGVLKRVDLPLKVHKLGVGKQEMWTAAFRELLLLLVAGCSLIVDHAQRAGWV